MLLRALLDGLKGGGLAGSGKSLQAVDAVAGGQYLLDGGALGRVEKRPDIRLGGRRLLDMIGGDGVLPVLHVLDGRQLRRDGLRSGEAASRVVFLSVRFPETRPARRGLEVGRGRGRTSCLPSLAGAHRA